MLDIRNLYLNQPSREYRLAFDLVADFLNNSKGKALCVFSTASQAVELLKRCPRPLEILEIGSFDVYEFTAAADGWIWEEIRIMGLGTLSPGYDIFLWVEPDASQADLISHRLRELANKNTRLLVINSGPLRKFLPARQEQTQPEDRPLSLKEMKQILRANRWQVESIRVFHGPRSITWSFLHRLSALLRRPDWSDRFLIATRASFQEPGWIWWLSPLSLICARAA